jgi:hypothetical protein
VGWHSPDNRKGPQRSTGTECVGQALLADCQAVTTKRAALSLARSVHGQGIAQAVGAASSAGSFPGARRVAGCEAPSETSNTLRCIIRLWQQKFPVSDKSIYDPRNAAIECECAHAPFHGQQSHQKIAQLLVCQ